MKKQPLVSIIIPTYNRAHLIGETLDSVLAQTYTNWECIVVDDGSTDDTDQLMASYCDKDDRFQYHHRPIDRLPGGNAARNYGLEVSRGEYVNWFDSDDIMFPDFLEARMKVFILNPKIGVVFSSFENVNENGERTRIANHKFSGNILNDLVEGNVSFGPLSYLIKKERLDDVYFNEKLRKNQDLDFFFRFFTTKENLKIGYVDTILFRVKSHSKSMSYTAGRDLQKMASIYQVYLMILEYFSTHKHVKGIERYKFRCLNSLKVMLRNGFYKQVIERLVEFPMLNSLEKLYLFGCICSHFCFKKGADQFVKVGKVTR